MSSVRDIPVSRKLTAISMLTSGVALVLACTAFLVYERNSFREMLAEDLVTTAQIMADNSASALSFNDEASAEQTLRSLTAKPHIIGAAIYDRDGQVFGTYHNSDDPLGLYFVPPPAEGDGARFGPQSLDVFLDILVDGEKAGTVFIRSSLEQIEERVWLFVRITIGVLLIAAIAALLLTTWLQGAISGPIAQLAHIVGQVARDKDYSLRAKPRGADELGRLVEGFNGMLDQIQARDSALLEAQATLERRVEERTAELKLEVAERRHAENALRRSEERFSSAFEHASIGMALLSPPGRFLKVNRALCTLLDYSEDELLARSFRDVIHPDDLQAVVAGMQALRAGESSSFQAQNRYIHKQGSCIWAQVSTSLVRDADGQPLYFIFQVDDITERKRAQQALADSETHLRALIEHSLDVIAITGVDGLVRYISPSVRKVAGYAPEELVGRSFGELVHPDDRAEAAEYFRRMVGQPGSSYRLERRYRHKNGSWIQSDNMSVSLVHVPAVAGIVTTMRDVTERKRTETALRNSEERFASAFEHASIGMALVSPEGRFVKVNRALCGLLGYSAEQIRARTLHDITHPHDLATSLAMMQKLCDGKGSSFQLEKRYLHADGSPLWAQVSVSLMRDAEGMPLHFITQVLDISQRKLAEEQLDETHRQLVEASRQSGMAEVATNVLHNVGNVLNSVNISASLVADRLKKSPVAGLARVVELLRTHDSSLVEFIAEDPRGKHLPVYLERLSEELHAEQANAIRELESLRTNVDHIKEIVAMQQSYSKVVGTTELVDVRDLVEDSLRMNEGALSRHGISIVREYGDVPPINVDKHKVLQILVNLVRNAKYACDEVDCNDKRLTLRVAPVGERVRIEVADNGIGILPENLTRIFRHGFTTRAGGHGYGLHSGALAAMELGGTLTASSPGPGMGATFTLELPQGSSAGNNELRPAAALSRIA